MDKLEKLPKKKKACRELSILHAHDEQQLLDWVMQHRQNGYVITRGVGAIGIQAIEISKVSILRLQPDIVTTS